MAEDCVTLDSDAYKAIQRELTALRTQVSQLQQAEIVLRQREERALRRSEERLRSLLSNVPGVVYRRRNDDEWTEEFVSSFVETVTGYPASDFIQNQVRSWASIMHPDDREVVTWEVQKTIAVKQPFMLEYRLFHRDGSIRWVYEKGQGVFDKNGDLLYLDGVIFDISDRKHQENRQKQIELALQQAKQDLELRIGERTTELQQTVEKLQQENQERKRVEEELRHSKQLLKLVIDNIPQQIFWKDRNSVYLGCNQNLAHALGLKNPQDIVGKTDYDFPLPDGEADRYRESDIKVMSSGIPDLHSIDVLCQLDGSKIWIDASKIPLRDANGEVVGVLGCYDDVTESKEAEEALEATNAEMRALFNAMDDLIFVLDGEGRHLKVPIAEKLYSVERDRVGKTLHEVLPEDIADEFLDYIQLALETQQTVKVEYSLTADGQELWSDASISPIDAVSVVWVVRDVTDRKQTENALRQSEAQLRQRTLELEQAFLELQQTQAQMVQSEKMSSLGQLVAGVAHEINNPVNFIYGNLSYARNYIKDLLYMLSLYQQTYPESNPEILEQAKAIDLDFLMADLPKLLDSMKVGADRIQQIVVSLRNFSRTDELQCKPVDIHEGIDNTLMILQNRIKANSSFPEISIIKEYGDLPLVECYVGQLNQVFMNILSNAIDALEEVMGKGKKTPNTPNICPPSLWIRICTKVLNSNRIAIHIADNGSGVSATAKQHLFNPFFTTKPVGKGTGLGLSISYQIVVGKHNGSLQCISEPGQGTEFVIELPIHQTMPLLEEDTKD